MPAISSEHRKLLENAVVAARDLAESGARGALQSLAVGLARPHDGMRDAEKALRNRLRAHGRQLGDRLDPNTAAQDVDRLVQEVAYAHWHRMLFARFLAENGLLIEPDSRVAVTLAECEELAREQRLDLWAMAGSFAQRMLPQIFRSDDPALAVALPPETRQQLERLVAGLPVEVFQADDALGWTYQFWQKAEKDRVNARAKSGEKISGATLPAVTQLFTEHYMVLFLLHNTLGAWHAGKVLAARPELAQQAQSEQELRAAVALPGYAFDYLRFVREGDGPWRPAAGVFAGWPKRAQELKVLDPCCGSGHFLVAGLELLSALRQHEEGLSAKDANLAVLGCNLFGLELDARCVQIAAFALAMAAWKRAGAVVELPALQVACCGIGPTGTKQQWLELAEQAAADGGMPAKVGPHGTEPSLLSVPIRNALEDLYLLFQKAPELGSLIDPKATAAGLYQAGYATVQPLLQRVLQSKAASEDAQEQAVVAQGMAKAAAILGQAFTLVVTNVPYLGRGAQGDVLKEFAEQHYPDAKADLATVFVQRAFGWLGKSGTIAVVTPQNWLFLTSYKKLRQKLLKERTWDCVARLGPRAFETIGGHVVNVALLGLSAARAADAHTMSGVDVSAAASPVQKAVLLRGEQPEAGAAPISAEPQDVSESAESEAGEESEAPSGAADGSVKLVPQADQLDDRDARITLKARSGAALLADCAEASHGIGTFDSQRFCRCWWEHELDEAWSLQQSSPGSTDAYAGCNYSVLWEKGDGQLAAFMAAKERDGYTSGKWRAGVGAWGKRGVIAGQMNDLPCTLFVGYAFDENASVLVPAEPANAAAVWSFCSSGEFAREVRSIDDSIKVTCKSLAKVPFDVAHWQQVAADQYPLGLPEPQTNDPTQWLFHGHPAGMTAAGGADASPLAVADPSLPKHPSLLCRTPNLADVLQVATARMLGYRWPAEIDAEMRLDEVQRAWTNRSQELLPFADEDGIVCLTPVRGEASAAERLRNLLRTAFGPQWRTETERKLLAAAAGDGRPAESLDAWLRDHFFVAHCKLFHDRPFVWHVCDGRKDGFHALVNYHRLAAPNGQGRATLDALTYTYLGEWIERQRQDQKQGVEGADGRLAAAQVLQGELKKILDGEPPYDLFVRWKPLHEQPLGWSPDIHDGVRLNIRPFLSAINVDKKGAGILRAKVRVSWGTDRGREPESLRPRAQFPWFWSCDPQGHANHRIDFGAPTKGAVPAGQAFDGVRWNDLHYTRAAKEAARKAAKS
jgi:hypothetical protein